MEEGKTLKNFKKQPVPHTIYIRGTIGWVVCDARALMRPALKFSGLRS